MTLKGTTIPIHEIDLNEGVKEVCAVDPSSAQLVLWHGQMQHDLGVISSKELAALEATAGQVSGRARTIYNPYTGEIRKVFLPDWVGKHRPEDPPIVGWTPASDKIKNQPKGK